VRLLREVPLVWLLLGYVVAWGIFSVFLSRLPQARRRTALYRLAMVAGALVVFAFVALNLYSLRDYVLNPDEANILSIAAASMHGQPMYHDVQSSQYSYAMIYGPLTFLIFQMGLWVGNGAFWALRLMSVLGNLLLCGVLYSIFRKFVRRGTAIALVAVALWPLFQYILDSLGLRPDLWIVLAMALAARCCLIERRLQAALLTGLFAGIAIDLKPTVAAAVVLLLLMLYRRGGIRFALTATVVATVTALLPFTLPGISMIKYWAWLVIARHEGFSPRLSAFSTGYVIALLLPFCVFWLCGIRPRQLQLGDKTGKFLWPELLALGGCLLVAVLVASKPGAGLWHFWQFPAILAVYLASAAGSAERQQTTQLDLAIWLVTLGSFTMVVAFLYRDVTQLRMASSAPGTALRAQLEEGRREIASYSAIYAGRTLQVGYGDQDRNLISTLRYLPVLHGQPYTLDNSPRIEVIYQSFPVGVLQQMDHCTGDVWLIPHNEKPFMTYMFPLDLPDTFVRDYRIQQRGSAFDAWVCKPKQ
jgi:hypothetical protein